MENAGKELRAILETFADSGWEALSAPACGYLEGALSREALRAAVARAGEACGACGCALDALYPRSLALLDALSATSEAGQCFGQFYDKTGT